MTQGSQPVAEKLEASGEIGGERTAGAKARVNSTVLAARLKSCPDTEPSQIGLVESFPQPGRDPPSLQPNRHGSETNSING